MAQSGSAPVWGTGGRRFKSGRPDQILIKASKLRVAVSSDYKFAEDQIAVKVVQRLGIGVVDATALAYLVSKTV